MLRSKKIVPAIVLGLAVTPVVRAAITIDGVLDASGYTRYATQTNNTSFGDSTSGDGLSTGGSELNAAYAKVEDGKLFVFVSGNISNDFNHLNIFVADGRAGQNTLSVSGTMGAMNGSKFSPGFNATYALDINGGGNPVTEYVNEYTMVGTPTSTYLQNFTANTGGPSTTLLHGIVASVNNTNVAGVVGGAPSAADTALAEAVTTGFEVAIPLSLLGNPSGGSLKILTALNGGNDGYLSNQFLPGLGSLTTSLGPTVGGKFDFSGAANQYFSVPVPVISNAGTWALAGSGSWNNAANWTGPVPQNATDTAILGASITSDATIALNGARTVGRLVFDNAAHKYTIVAGTPAGTLTISDVGDAGGENPLISVLSGTHEIAAPLALANGVSVNVDDGSSLAVSGVLSGIGNVKKIGGGELVLSANNTFVGDIMIEGGALKINTMGALSGAAVSLGDPTSDGVAATLSLGTSGMNFNIPLTTKRDLQNSGAIRYVTSAVAGNNTISGNINVNGGVSLGAATGGTLTVSGVIQDGLDTGDSIKHDVRVNGQGYVVLTAANTATGDTFVDNGTLVLNSGASLAGGSLNVFTNGAAVIKGNFTSANPVKIYAQGKVYFPGATSGAVSINTSTLTVDNGGLIQVQDSSSTANPVTLNAGSVEFTGSPSNGQIDLRNNRLITTNTADVVRQQLQFANLVTSRTDGTLGYSDLGDGTTRVQFALGGDADLNGKVNTLDFNMLAGGFGPTPTWVGGDFSYDGQVDSVDFGILVANYGKTLPAAGVGLGSVVPEPASAALLVVGAVSLLGRRRRD